MDDRYHRAARDGRLDLLKQAYKRDLNEPDEDGMTPTLWAAYHGNLEALKLCCKRGGDPDKCDYTGNTGLHLTAQNGHLTCLSFLVKLGVNMWQLDNDYNSALMVAGNRGHHDCVKYLDDFINKYKAAHPKKAVRKEENAKKEADERRKKYVKRQQVQDRKIEKFKKTEEKRRISTIIKPSAPVRKISTVSTANYSAALQTNHSLSVFSQKKVPDKSNEFVVSEKGRRISRTINGVLSKEVANVMYLEKEGMASGLKTAANKRPPLQGFFPDEEEQTRENNDMPRFGAITLVNNYNSANAWYSALQSDNNANNEQKEESIIPSSSKPVLKPSSEEDITRSDEEDSTDDEDTAALASFLDSVGLPEYLQLFIEEQMDMDALKMCSMEDLKEIEIPFGPRKKIFEALKSRKGETESNLTSF